MIVIVLSGFLILSLSLTLLFSYEFRLITIRSIRLFLPRSRQTLSRFQNIAIQINQAASPHMLQNYWHVQQWWILAAGLSLFLSILFFVLTRPIDPLQIEADYLKTSDPQIYTLLKGEMLIPPPEEDEQMINAAIAEAVQLAQPDIHSNAVAAQGIPYSAENTETHLHSQSTDRKWNRIHPRYKQRLLMVFKLMKERHNYELVLLEGYRNPERQNQLSQNAATTRAKAFQSFHQFGLAADVAFKRNGKVVISERDPWAMRGYQLYGETAESVGLTWGGRWTSIQDYGHTEYHMPGLKKTQEMAEKLLAEAELSVLNNS